MPVAGAVSDGSRPTDHGAGPPVERMGGINDGGRQWRLLPPLRNGPQGMQRVTTAELRARAELAELRLADLSDDMERQRDKWETVAQRLALPAPTETHVPTATRLSSLGRHQGAVGWVAAGNISVYNSR